MPKDYQKLFVALSIASLISVNYCDGHSGRWDYRGSINWKKDFNDCGNSHQSPINLKSSEAELVLFGIETVRYDMDLNGPLTLHNNNHTVVMDIPSQKYGRPYVVTHFPNNTYEAMTLHFHWGEPFGKGSEHSIEGIFFAIELHIIHKNIKYDTFREALHQNDGLVVFGIMIEPTNNIELTSKELNEFFNLLTKVTPYNSRATLGDNFKLNYFTQSVDTKKFFNYKGSLTTPPCYEVVNWYVFKDPVLVSTKNVAKFWNILDQNGNAIYNNRRPLQHQNNPHVYEMK